MAPDFHFLRPLWLLLLVPLAVLLWRLARGGADGDAWRAVVEPHLLRRLLSDGGGAAQRLPWVLLGLGWLLAVLALAGPTWERLPEPVYQAQQYRVVVLDLSPSMNATDLAPSRLAHARFEVLDLLRRAGEGQTALLAYGAEPYVVSPLTSDAATIAAQVPGLATGLLPVQGDRRTDLALEQAGELLQQAGAPSGEVILVTDELDNPGAAVEAARALRADGYSVSVLGVGTAKGAPVPLAEGGFQKDRSGAIRMPKLDAAALATLARAGGGRYVVAGADDRDIEALIPAQPSALVRGAEQQDTRADRWREAGPWLLLVLLPIAALGFRRGWLAPLLLVVFLAPPPDVQAFGWKDLWLRPDQQAARAFAQGEHQEAAERFRRPDWRAAAQYRAGDYAKALESLKEQGGPEAGYNQGNALARLGRLEEAVAAYDRALEQAPEHADARHNRDLVQKLLDRQRQQQEQKEQQGQQGQQGQKDQQGGQDQKGQQGQQGEQGQQGQKDQQGGQDQKGQQGQQGEQGQQGAGQERKDQQDPRDRRDQEGRQEQQGDQSDQDQKDQQGQRDAQNPQDQQGKQAQRAQQEQADAQAQGSDTSQSEGSPQGDSEIPHSEFRTPNSNPPGLADLLGGDQSKPAGRAAAQVPPVDPEDAQAMEQMLRRVEDDPAGLLRQRFLLQHLRRSGQLP